MRIYCDEIWAQPRSQGFSLFRGGGREKALASAGHVLVLNIHYNTNVWIPVVNSAFLLVDVIDFDLSWNVPEIVALLSYNPVNHS